MRRRTLNCMDWTPIIEATTAGVVGLAVIVMAVSILRLARHNRGLGIEVRRLVNNNVALQEAAGLQAEEARRDSALATQPLLVLLDEPPPGIRDQPWAAVKVRNVGNGSALYFVVWMLAAGSLYHSAGAEAGGSRARCTWRRATSSSPVRSRTCSPSARCMGTSILDPRW